MPGRSDQIWLSARSAAPPDIALPGASQPPSYFLSESQFPSFRRDRRSLGGRRLAAGRSGYRLSAVGPAAQAAAPLEAVVARRAVVPTIGFLIHLRLRHRHRLHAPLLAPCPALQGALPL
jgi:hypothetical protein